MRPQTVISREGVTLPSWRPLLLVGLVLSFLLLGALSPTFASPKQLEADAEIHSHITIDSKQRVSGQTIVAMHVENVARATGESVGSVRDDLCPSQEDVDSNILSGDQVPGTTVDMLTNEYCGYIITVPATPLDQFFADMYNFEDINPEGGAVLEDVTYTGEDSVYLDLYVPFSASDVEDIMSVNTSLVVEFPGAVTSAPGANISGNTATWNLQTAPTEPEAFGEMSSFPWWIVWTFIVMVVVVVAAGVVLLVLRARSTNRGGTNGYGGQGQPGPGYGGPGSPGPGPGYGAPHQNSPMNGVPGPQHFGSGPQGGPPPPPPPPYRGSGQGFPPPPPRVN